MGHHRVGKNERLNKHFKLARMEDWIQGHCVFNLPFLPTWWWPNGPKHVVEVIMNKWTILFDRIYCASWYMVFDLWNQGRVRWKQIAHTQRHPRFVCMPAHTCVYRIIIYMKMIVTSCCNLNVWAMFWVNYINMTNEPTGSDHWLLSNKRPPHTHKDTNTHRQTDTHTHTKGNSNIWQLSVINSIYMYTSMTQYNHTNTLNNYHLALYIHHISSSVMAFLLWDHSAVGVLVWCDCVGHKALCNQCICDGSVGWGTALQAMGSNPDGVIGIIHWHNPSGRTMALSLTQPLTEMSTRNTNWEVKVASV
jgi:hypothetical protein